MPKAMVVGATGQDGSILCSKLLDRGYTVSGSRRPTSSDNFWRIDLQGIGSRIEWFEYSIGNPANLSQKMKEQQPDLIFFAAGDSSTASSEDFPARVITSNVVGCAEQIEAYRSTGIRSKTLFFGSAEKFGYAANSGQIINEDQVPNPSTTYGHSKNFSSSLVRHYREEEGLRFFEAILFPHESKFRSGAFVVQKIVRTLTRASMRSNMSEIVSFGDVSSTRDWGCANQYMSWAISLLESSEEPDEYIFSTGVGNSVWDVFKLVGEVLGMELGIEESREGTIVFDLVTGRQIALASSRRLGNTGHGYLGSSFRLFSEIGRQEVRPIREVLTEMVVAEKGRLDPSSL